MTVLTKPSLIIKKADVTEAPLVDDNVCDEEKIDIHPAGVPYVRSRSSGGLMCMSLTALMMAAVGIICGLLLYRQYLHTNAVRRYQGFCTIPMDARQQAQLRWRADPDVQVFSTLEDSSDSEGTLLERFDIGDNYEKVMVIDNGHNFEFIHDFNVNLTGIVEEARCFMMSLEPSLVLPPARLAAGLAAGARFDVSRVRSALRAEPAAPAAARAALLLLDACLDKPVYMLKQDDNVQIRKRSADEPPHEFIQFSGNHVQEIEIGNMDEILAYEKAQGRAALATRVAFVDSPPAPGQARLTPGEPHLAPQDSRLAREDSPLAPERAPLALPMESPAR
ncbi:uncharacterized protein LOC106132191 [Amyelois transitella]|uniref:uncharacterized protein LOC106132191 n=1 Tax=Amyelois transitella TaxID=680683 RepID=UPI002990447F|nr:uncharacterized protein LOC106132191 [Amyelois transitella]